MHSADSELLTRQIKMLIRRVRHEQLAVEGVSNVELHVLTLIAVGPRPLRPGQLCEELHMTTPNMAATLRKLEGLGLIIRQPDPADGRQKLVLATDVGRQMVEETRAVRHGWLRDAIGRLLNESEQRLLAQAGELMERLAEDQMTRRRTKRSAQAASHRSALPDESSQQAAN